MSIITIILTAFALAMDAFAVSITKGMTLKKLTKGTAIKIALFLIILWFNRIKSRTKKFSEFSILSC